MYLSLSEFYKILGALPPCPPPLGTPLLSIQSYRIMLIHGTYVDNKKIERFLDDSEKGQSIFCGIANQGIMICISYT